MPAPTNTAASKIRGDLKDLYKPVGIAAVSATAACRGSAAPKSPK